MKEIVLGTVQLGLNYGINNKSGKPSEEDAMNILKYAYKNGIDTFDTAAAYGDSEEVIGRFIKKNNLAEKIKIITKLLPNIFDKKTGDIGDIIEEEIRGSMKRLNISTIHGYLLHTPAYVYNNEVIQGLMKAKEKGLIENFGVSIYEPEEALYAVKNTNIDYIQIPYNIFDERLDKTDFFSTAQEKGIRVFARTAFIQGLVLMKDEDIPEHLSEAKEYFHDFDVIIEKHHISRAEAALLFVQTHKNIDHAVIGVETVQQLTEDIDIANRQQDFDACRQELKDKFRDINKILFFPSLWSKK